MSVLCKNTNYIYVEYILELEVGGMQEGNVHPFSLTGLLTELFLFVFILFCWIV